VAQTEIEAATRWSPQPGPQADAIATAPWCDELLYGGAAGGGKTFFLILDFLADLEQGASWTGILFRQSYPELDEIIDQTQQVYPHTGGEYLVGQRVWKWPNGAMLRLRHLEGPNDFAKYLGHAFAWQGWDELPMHESLKPYHMMKSRLRGPALNKRIRATGNPGGRCHAEIKEYFRIGEFPEGYNMMEDKQSQMSRMFIPSKVSDNKILLDKDPGYIDRLRGVADKELTDAWLNGSWDSIVGAYLSMLRRDQVVVDPFEIPRGWTVFTCGDYGETNPTWWGILAVDFDDDIYVVDEYQRSDAGGADHARSVRALIDHCPLIIGHRPRLNLAPHDMWTVRRPGEASQALAPADSFIREGIHLTRANMERVNGWRNMKDLFYADRVKFFKGRTDRVLSSLASLQRDVNNPEDVWKGGDDHASDGLRLGINHVYRPRKVEAPQRKEANTGLAILDLLSKMGRSKSRYN
jgi:hypothetical protein